MAMTGHDGAMTRMVKTLAEMVADHGPLRVRDGLGWVLRAARTVELLHGQGVAHGRLSPAAILVADSECSSTAQLLHPREVDDQLEYHSLKRAETGKPSGSDDVWALRVMLYFLITGELPYPEGVAEALTSSGRVRAPTQLAVHGRDLTVMQPLMDEILEADDRLDLLHDPTTLAHQLQRFSPTIADLPALDADFVKDGALVKRSRGGRKRDSSAPASTSEPPPGAPRVAAKRKRRSGHLGPLVIALGAAALLAALAFNWHRDRETTTTPTRPAGSTPTATQPATTAAPSRPTPTTAPTASNRASAGPSASTLPRPPEPSAAPPASAPQPTAKLPLSGPQLAECVLPVLATKLTSAPDLDFLCVEQEAMLCVHKLAGTLRKLRSREGRGAARAWERLGWYQMAALALARQRCCVPPGELKGPDHLRGCHLDAALAQLVAGESEAAFITGLEAYTKAIRCIEQIRPKDWPNAGSPSLVQQSALLRKRSQAVGAR